MDDILHLDFETYCELNIKDVSRVKYVAHESFEILCFAWAINDEEEQLWEPSQPIPKRFIDAVENPNVLIAAWNAQFEWSVLNRCLEFLGLQSPVPLRKMLDVQAVACRYNFPAKLEVTGKILKQPKQEDGLALIKMLCQPQPGLAEGRWTPLTAPQAFERFYGYCRQDVLSERGILNSLPKKDLSLDEKQVWIHTAMQNNRGIRIDKPLVRNIITRLEEWQELNVEKLKKITDGAITTGHQTQRMKNFAADFGINLPNMQADTISPIILDPDVPKVVRQVLKIRQNLGKISTKKYYRMELQELEGMVYDNLIYAGARTDRYLHVGLQLGNLPARTGFKDVIKNYDERFSNLDECVDACIEAFGTDIDAVRGLTPNVMALASVMIRPCLIPHEGYEWMVGDYSSIENRFGHWLAGDEETLEEFRQGLDQYKTFASDLYGIPYEKVSDRQRFHGKTAILGLIFMMGAGTYRHTAHGYGIPLSEEDSERTVKVYRGKYRKVVKMWYGLYDAAKEAVENPGRVTSYIHIKFQVKNGYLHTRLPTGKCLRYYKPFIKEKLMPWGKYKNIIHFRGTLPNTQGRGWGVIELPPAQNVENIVQGVAREALVRGMISAEKLRYKALCSVHDEGMHIVKKGQGSVEEFSHAMCDIGDWCKGLPLKVEAYRAMRYRK